MGWACMAPNGMVLLAFIDDVTAEITTLSKSSRVQAGFKMMVMFTVMKVCPNYFQLLKFFLFLAFKIISRLSFTS